MNAPELLLKHAKKYGTDGIVETAVEIGFTVDQMVALLKSLDDLDHEKLNEGRQFKSKKRKVSQATYERRARRALGIEETEEENG